MPVEFLADEEAAVFGCYAGPPTRAELDRMFYLDDEDLRLIAKRRGDRGFTATAVDWQGTEIGYGGGDTLAEALLRIHRRPARAGHAGQGPSNPWEETSGPYSDEPRSEQHSNTHADVVPEREVPVSLPLSGRLAGLFVPLLYQPRYTPLCDAVGGCGRRRREPLRRQMRPVSWAHMATSTRFRAPSFRMRLARWALTVLGVM